MKVHPFIRSTFYFLTFVVLFIEIFLSVVLYGSFIERLISFNLVSWAFMILSLVLSFVILISFIILNKNQRAFMIKTQKITLLLLLTFLAGGLLSHFFHCDYYWPLKYLTGIVSGLLYAIMIQYRRSFANGIIATLIAFAGTIFCDTIEHIETGFDPSCNPNILYIYGWWVYRDLPQICIFLTFFLPYFLVQGYFKKILDQPVSS